MYRPDNFYQSYTLYVQTEILHVLEYKVSEDLDVGYNLQTPGLQ